MENIAFPLWQILYTFVLRVENNTQLIPLGIHFSRIISQGYIFYSLQILRPNFAILLSLGCSFKLW